MESVRRLLYRWLLIPLTGLLVLTALLGYPIVLYPVTEALDWALMDSARSLARHINTSEGYAALAVSSADDAMLRSDGYDRIYYSVRAGDGTLLAGDTKVAQPARPIPETNDLYYDSVIDGEPVRVAAMTLNRDGANLTIQVAETTVKRTRLARQILVGVIFVEVVLIATVALLVLIGIRKGLAPLQRLRAELQARSPEDLRPVPEAHAPVEAQPLVRAINGLLDQLAHAWRAQQQFVANAAHQLRTPLAGLRMQVEYALRQENPQEWRRALGMLTPVTERTVHLVHQLLTLARTEANAGGAASMAAVDLSSIVQEAAGHCMPKAIDRDIDLGLELTRSPVVGDALLLGELVTNLIDNALTYSAHGSHVTVRAANFDGHSVLEVEDEGPGIAQSERTRIFERFYRTIGSAGEGCGLGLAIVQEIAQLHQAQVAISNPDGHSGTVVIVTFPELRAP
jgi:two-component system sensor histidine kinase TctE